MHIKTGDLFSGRYNGFLYVVTDKENGLKPTFRLFSLTSSRYIFERDITLIDPYVYVKLT